MSENENKWKTYLHVSKIDGRMYCGITSQPLVDRWSYGKGYKGCSHFSRAIKKYGWDSFEHIVLLAFGTKEEAEELEKTIIRCCHLQDKRYGFNIQDGGYDSAQISEEGKLRLHDAFYRSANPRARKVVLFDYKTGKRSKSFDCMKDCADFLGIKSAGLDKYVHLGSNAFHREYFVRYYDDVLDAEVLPNHTEMIEKYRFPHYVKKVNQYAPNGKFIKTYPSVSSAAEATGLQSNEISAAINAWKNQKRGRKSAGGFMWRLYNGDTSDIDPIRLKTAIHVQQTDINTGKIVGEYVTIAEASRATGIGRGSIRHAVFSKKHIAGNYLWKSIDKFSNVQGEK